MIILDASAAICVVRRASEGQEVEKFIASSECILAPDLFLSETANVFWKYCQFDSLSPEIGRQMLDKAIGLVDVFLSSQDLAKEAFTLACSANCSAYDALYLVAARRNSGTLITLDKKLQTIASKQDIDFVLI